MSAHVVQSPIYGVGGVAVSSTNTYLSSVLDLKEIGLDLNFFCVYEGGMQGSLFLEASNDYSPVTTKGNWVKVSAVTFTGPGTAISNTNGVTSPTLVGSSTNDGVTIAVAANPLPGSNLPPSPVPIGRITSATYGFVSAGVVAGQFIVLSGGSSGDDDGTYVIKSVVSATEVDVYAPLGFVGDTTITIQVVSPLTGTLTSSGATFSASGIIPGMQVQLSSGNDIGWFTVLAAGSTVATLQTDWPGNPGPMVGGSSVHYNFPQLEMANVSFAGARFYRLVYVNASSTGTLYVTATAKAD